MVAAAAYEALAAARLAAWVLCFPLRPVWRALRPPPGEPEDPSKALREQVQQAADCCSGLETLLAEQRRSYDEELQEQRRSCEQLAGERDGYNEELQAQRRSCEQLSSERDGYHEELQAQRLSCEQVAGERDRHHEELQVQRRSCEQLAGERDGYYEELQAQHYIIVQHSLV